MELRSNIYTKFSRDSSRRDIVVRDNLYLTLPFYHETEMMMNRYFDIGMDYDDIKTAIYGYLSFLRDNDICQVKRNDNDVIKDIFAIMWTSVHDAIHPLEKEMHIQYLMDYFKLINWFFYKNLYYPHQEDSEMKYSNYVFFDLKINGDIILLYIGD